MKIARVFLDTDMRLGFQGLHKILLKVKVDPRNLDPEAYYVFINAASTKFKLITGKYLVYYNNGNRRIPLEAIQYLPKNFGGSETEINESIKRALQKRLGIK